METESGKAKGAALLAAWLSAPTFEEDILINLWKISLLEMITKQIKVLNVEVLFISYVSYHYHITCFHEFAYKSILDYVIVSRKLDIIWLKLEHESYIII